MAKLKGLGRGLDSLLSSSSDDLDNPVKLIELNKLFSGKTQPRKSFNDQSLESLSESIRSSGIMQPIVVRKTEFDDKYEIIAGERRWLAAQKAGLHEVPVVVTEADDLKSLEFAIVENVQRHDLNPLEEAQGYKRLIDEFSYDQEKVSKFIGKSRSHIANIIRLLGLPQSIQDMISEGKISSGHARAIMNSAFPEQLAEKIVSENLSVRAAEDLAKQRKPAVKKVKLKDPDTIDLENNLTAKLGLNVLIDHKGKKGGSGSEKEEINEGSGTCR